MKFGTTGVQNPNELREKVLRWKKGRLVEGRIKKETQSFSGEGSVLCPTSGILLQERRKTVRSSRDYLGIADMGADAEERERAKIERKSLIR